MDASKLRLGDTEVPRIGLGTNRLTNTSEHVALVKEAVAAGLGHIDTAHSYAGGESEETIGAALSPVAEGVVVATKGGWGAGNGRPDVLRDPETRLEDSLGAIIERAREVVPVAAVQNNYSLAERKHEDVLDYCAAEGIVFVPFFPLRGVGSRQLSEIADRHGASAAQIALAWLLRRSPTTLPIPGTLSLEHLKENLAALEIELSDAEFETLR
jgi:pyridoxine 4-dehydrogenase